MKVKVPREIKVAGRTYKIYFKHNLIRDEGDRGRVYWHTQEIFLSNQLLPEQRTVSFLHELLHSIDEHYCGRIGISEEVTNGLSEGLFQFLKDTLDIEFDWSEIEEEK